MLEQTNSIPTANEVWTSAYRILEQSLPSNTLQRWIEPLRPEQLRLSSEGLLTLSLKADHEFSAQWVRDSHLMTIRSAVEQVLGKTCDIKIQSQENGLLSNMVLNAGVVSGEPNLPPLEQEAPRIEIQSATPNHPNHIDPHYTFESFVVGASNQFAHASAIAVAEQPARQYNPLLIYSNPGLGKTHLLHAIGNYTLTKNPRARVTYLSAENFVNELIDSIQHNRMPKFRTKYRDSFDLILIDDIQFIAGKARSEEEFFHTFNALHSSKRQIVLTSDRPPKEIENLETRLRTRLEWGLVADIQPPEIETRIAILKSKAENEDIYLPDDVAAFLATYIKSNVRELEGILVKLQAQSSLSGAEISLEMAKYELRNQAPLDGGQYTVESIQNAVAKHFKIKVQDLRSDSRTQGVALARQIAMYLIRKYTGMSFKELGSYFGGRDHSTTLHACKKIDSALETDPAIYDAVEAVQNLL